MSQHTHLMGKRLLSLALAILLAAACSFPAAAAEPIGDGVTPTYDEAYYATLDYYGNLLDGSVVKSYTLNGATSLTDYGIYDEVVNLTDGTAPAVAGNATTFSFSRSDAPSHFYFEGKTAAPFEALPWTLSVSYTLNGVAVRAEDLAGKTGVVEITVNAIPNENASEYARNNYTLEAMAVFNQDNILSLEAPGAQVQLIGNLRAVLFIALPGEEQHFVIRVGCEDFSFDGMTFLMVPATLDQLEEIAKLSQRKDDLEEDYNKLSGSLDTLLDSFSDLGSSLRATADGLDDLNQARDTISSGKDRIYADGDKVLEDLENLSGSLNTLPGHLDDTDDSVTEVTDSLSKVTDTAVILRENLDDVDDCLKDLQRDIKNIRSGSGDMQSHLNQLGTDLKKLQTSLQELKETLQLLDIRINGGLISELPSNVQEKIKVQGQQLDAMLTQVQGLETVWAGVATDSEGNATETIGYQQYQVAALIASGKASSAADATTLLQQIQAVDAGIASVKAVYPALSDEGALSALVAQGRLTQDQAAQYAAAKPQLIVMEQVYITVCGGTDQLMTKADFFTAILMLSDINALPADQKTPENIGKILANEAAYAKTGKMLSELNGDHDLSKVTGLLENLSDLLTDMGSGGLTGDLSSLVGKTDTTLGHLDDAADVGRDILDRVDTLLGDIKNLDDTINDQVPGLRSTLQDTKTLVTDMVTTIDDTHGFLTSFRSLAKTSGTQLDEGTKKSLENLAATLRKTARSTDAVGDVKTAKDTINGIIEDTWNEYTGDINNLLLMDATAQAVSLTSEENPAPSSIQVLIRTQEIKKSDSSAEITAQAQAAEPTTFLGRVAQMFRDFWDTITGLFR